MFQILQNYIWWFKSQLIFLSVWMDNTSAQYYTRDQVASTDPKMEKKITKYIGEKTIVYPALLKISIFHASLWTCTGNTLYQK